MAQRSAPRLRDVPGARSDGQRPATTINPRRRQAIKGNGTHLPAAEKHTVARQWEKNVPLNPRSEWLAYPRSANNSNTVQTKAQLQSKWQNFYIFPPPSAETPPCATTPMDLCIGGSYLISGVKTEQVLVPTNLRSKSIQKENTLFLHSTG